MYVNENEKSIEALELSFQIKEEGGIFEIGFKYIDMVSIAIRFLLELEPMRNYMVLLQELFLKITI